MFPWLLALGFAMFAVWAYLQALYWRELYEEERRINASPDEKERGAP